MEVSLLGGAALRRCDKDLAVITRFSAGDCKTTWLPAY